MSQKGSMEPSVGSELERFILHHARLQPGDKLEGRVIQVRDDGRVLINFGPFRALADTQFPIKEGEVIHVMVVSRQPRLKLRLETPRVIVSPGMRQVIRNLEMVSEERWDSVSDTIGRILDVRRVGEWLFPPVIQKSLVGLNPQARLKCLPAGQFSLLLYIDLWGPVRVDFTFLNRDLNITFYAGQAETVAQLESHLPGIRQRLVDRYEHLVLHAFQSERKIAEFDTENLAIPMEEKMLDVKV